MNQRVKRAAFFWTISISLFAVVGLTRYFDSVWQDSGPPFSIGWFITVLIATGTGAIILWALSWSNPKAWRIIQRLVGTDESDDKQQSTIQAAQTSLRSMLNKNEALKCPRCGNTGHNFMQNLVPMKNEKGVTILGRELGFISEKPVDRIHCGHCGYIFHRPV